MRKKSSDTYSHIRVERRTQKTGGRKVKTGTPSISVYSAEMLGGIKVVNRREERKGRDRVVVLLIFVGDVNRE